MPEEVLRLVEQIERLRSREGEQVVGGRADVQGRERLYRWFLSGNRRRGDQCRIDCRLDLSDEVGRALLTRGRELSNGRDLRITERRHDLDDLPARRVSVRRVEVAVTGRAARC